MIKQNASNKDPNLPEQSHAVILLASGLSQRLGQPKQLLKKQSQPLLEVMTNLAMATNPSAILLVVASLQSETIQLGQTLAAQNNVVMPVINTEPEQGMAHSLCLAIDTLTAKVAQGLHIERVLILGVDQILLEATHLQQLLVGDNGIRGIKQVDSYNKVIASHYPKSYEITEKTSSHLEHTDDSKSIVGLPINIDYQLLTQWQPLLNGDKGLRYLIRGLSSEELSVVDNSKLSLDIDTPEQLQFAIMQYVMATLADENVVRKLIDENQTDFLVHVKGDTYLKVKVKDDKIVIFKTIVKGE